MSKKKESKSLVKNAMSSKAPNVSEYKIGNTTYIVELHFCGDNSETLKAIISRMIAREIKNDDYSA